MTVITIDNIALAEILKPFFCIVFAIIIGLIIYYILKIFIGICEDKKEQEKLKQVRQLYAARQRQFKNNPEEWKKWKDANYEIMDLMEAEIYY